MTLRRWRQEDVGAVVAALDDPEIERFLDHVPQPYGEADALAWFESIDRAWADGSFAGFAIELDGRAVGSMALGFKEDRSVAEAGYWLAAEHRGRGVTTRALRLVAAWAFRECGIERLELRADVENVASQRVAQKAGFTREGVLRAQRYNPRLGRRVDLVMFSLLRGELNLSS